MAAVNEGTGSGKSKTRILAVVGIVILFVLGFAGVQYYINQKAYVSTDDAKVTGTILNASSKIPGKVVSVNVSEGSKVKKGDILFTLDKSLLQAQVNQAQAGLDVAKAQLAKVTSGARSEQVAATQAGVDQAQAGYNAAVSSRDSVQTLLNDAQNNYNTLMAQMSESGYINPSTGQPDANYAAIQITKQYKFVKTIDSTQYQLQMQALQQAFAAQSQLQAQIDQLKGQLNTLNAQVSGAKAAVSGANSQLNLVKDGATNNDVAIVEAQVRAAQAAYDMAKLNLDSATVTAPSDGTVVQVNVHAGDVIGAGQAAISLVNLSDLQVTAYVLETDLEKVKPGQDVQLSIDAFPGTTFTGRVQELGQATASVFNIFDTSNASGNYTKVTQRVPVKIDFDTAGQPVIPGMSVTAKIKIVN